MSKRASSSSRTRGSPSEWKQLKQQAADLVQSEPLLKPWIDAIFQKDLAHAIAYILASRLGTKRLSTESWIDILVPIYNSDTRIQPVGINVSKDFVAPAINQSIIADLQATQRHPSSKSLLHVLLFSKGYHALCAYRAMHYLWYEDRYTLAHYLQSRVSKAFSIDIHPKTVIGSGIFIAHGSGVVIGATAVVENNITLMQQVTLGGTGKDSADRHPKIRDNVFVGAGAQILGNIEVAEGAFVSAASVVLKPVDARTKVAGVPAQVTLA